jgi:uncharacterized protein
MTYKRADRPGWPRLRAQRFVYQRVTDAAFTGYVSLLRMEEVAEPLWVMHGDQKVCIADAGYSWLQVFPDDAHHTHTTMFNPDGQPVQEYIDVIAEQGVGDDGIPWYDDLYLDLTWIPDGTPLLLDQEELEAAHAIQAISQEQYDLARGEVARLLVALTLGEYCLAEIAHACYPILKAELDAESMMPSPASETPGAEETAEAETTETRAAAETATADGATADGASETVAAPTTPSVAETTETPALATAEALETTTAPETRPGATAEREIETSDDVDQVERSEAQQLTDDDEQRA